MTLTNPIIAKDEKKFPIFNFKSRILYEEIYEVERFLLEFFELLI